MNSNILTNNAHQQLDPQADLDNKLRYFNQPPIQATVRSNALTNANPNIQQENPVNETEVEQNTTQEGVTEGEQEQGEATTEGDEEAVSPAFAEAFKGYFGMEPDEAINTVNQLVAFRDEMTLMRQWGVSPTEYDQRMSAVKDFYNTLPEDGREQFNTIEGAQSIWEHLQKNGQAPSTTTKRTSSSKPASRIKQASAPKQEFLKKSDILKMDTATYQNNLPKITKAFQEGRVIFDA